jgi:hypothetical protein
MLFVLLKVTVKVFYSNYTFGIFKINVSQISKSNYENQAVKSKRADKTAKMIILI